MFDRRRKGFYFSVFIILCICVGAGVYIHHALSQIGRDLTDEFHETYFHANKLELDTAKFALLIEQFSNTPTPEIYEKMVESIDLIFLRVGVVVDSSEQFSASTREYSTHLSPPLEEIDKHISVGLQDAYDSLDLVRAELVDFVAVEQEVSRRFIIHVEGSIGNANKTIDSSIFQVVVILMILAISFITLVILFYRKSTIAAELEKSEDNIRRIVDLIPLQICVRDSDGYIKLANARVSAEFGASVETLTGSYFTDFHPSKSEAEKTLEDDRAVISQQNPRIDIEDVSENQSGEKRWFSTSKVPFTKKEHNEQLILCIKQDITKQKQAELMVRNSEERLQLALEGADLGLWDWNLLTGAAHYSDRFYTMLGYDVGEIATDSTLWRKLVHPDDLRRAKSEFVDCLSQNKSNWSIEYRLRKKDGGYRWITCHGKVVECDKSGKPVRAAGTHLDITESVEAARQKLRLEAQLSQARKMEAIGTLAGGIAHDFNNILTAIMGFSELARNDLQEGTRAKENMSKVLSAGNRAKDLVKNILAFSRKSNEQRSPVKLQRLLRDVIDLMRASLPSTIDLRLTVDETCGQIRADHNQIHQILMNLCTNSAQAMNDTGGILELSLESQELSIIDVKIEPEVGPGSFLHITVADNGPGIESSIIDKIFDPYFTTKGVGKGSGMGLAIVKGIVRSHDGFVRVESESGKGTQFHLYFPEIFEQELAQDKIDGALEHGNETLLIIDDEQMIVDMNKMLFTQLGYKVVATTDSMEGLKLFTAGPDDFDLVITDQTMPKLTGEELAGKMLELQPDIPIILCTGYSERMSEARCQEMGIAQLVSKPVDIVYISRLVRQELDNRKDATRPNFS
ncbi:MAG: PAS domain S-box-containing protein [Desulforhopalus sp.]|jgi:PAS domain S-box-containing protein